MRNSDFRHLIESAYDIRSSPSAWLYNVLSAARPLLERDAGLYVWYYDLRRLPAITALQCIGDSPTAERMLAGYVEADANTVFRAYQHHGSVCFLSSAIGVAATKSFYRHAFPEIDLADCVCVRCTDSDGQGFGIGAGISSRLAGKLRMSRNEVGQWGRISAHLTAALRLRRLQRPDEAVLTPAGQVAHAEGCARSVDARDALRSAAIAMDRARSRNRSIADTLDLWRVLVVGRWTLVDTFDHDGKRLLIARNNTPVVQDAPGLTARESQTVTFAAMGHSIKVIAYELGITESSVATYLRRGLMKLKLPNRLALTERLPALLGVPPAL